MLNNKQSTGMIRLEPTSASNKIVDTTVDSEFEVQAWLYWMLKQAGLTVKGEVKQPFLNDGKRSACRFDLVVFDGGFAKAIIEVKSSPIRHKTSLEETRQCSRYRCYGVPVIFVYGMDGARLALKHITAADGVVLP